MSRFYVGICSSILQDPLKQSSQMLVNKMLLESEHVEVPQQESFTSPCLELAKKLFLDLCVDATVVMQQDVCNKPKPDQVLEPVHDPTLQVHKNEMVCEPIKVHNEQHLLSQNPLEMSSDLLSTTTSCQNVVDKPEVQFLSVCSAMETD